MFTPRHTALVAYFRVLEERGGKIIRVPVTMAEHNEAVKEDLQAWFVRRFGRMTCWPGNQQLVISDRHHLALSVKEDAIYHAGQAIKARGGLWRARAQGQLIWRALCEIFQDEAGAIAFCNATTINQFGDFSQTNSISFNPTNADVLCVQAGNDRSGSGTTIDSCTWNSLSLTGQTGQLAPGGAAGRFFHRVGSMNGAQTLLITNSSASTKPTAVAASYSGVDQTNPVNDVVFENATANTPGSTVANLASGDLALAAFIGNIVGTTITGAGGTTVRANTQFTGIGQGGIGDNTGTGSVAVGFTTTGNPNYTATSVRLQVAGTTGLSVNVNDTATPSEFVFAQISVMVVVSETETVTESVTATLNPVLVSVFDTTTPTEFVNPYVTMRAQVLDTTSPAELVNGLLVTHGEYTTVPGVHGVYAPGIQPGRSYSRWG